MEEREDGKRCSRRAGPLIQKKHSRCQNQEHVEEFIEARVVARGSGEARGE